MRADVLIGRMISTRQIGFFVGALSICFVLCTILWESVVAQAIYHCTDPGFLEFLDPGQWYHPLHGDTIKAGWNQQTLWKLWSGMWATSVVIALTASWKFRTGRNQNKNLEHISDSANAVWKCSGQRSGTRR